MTTLAETLLNVKHRAAIIADVASRVEDRVTHATGLRGLGLKAGLAAIRKVWPDAVPRVVGQMLPEFVNALEPLFQKYHASGERDFSAYLKRHSAAARDALMKIADARADVTRHAALRSGYRKLRGTLATELEAMLPELVKGVSAHLANLR